jgi:hypothetical protein
MNYLRGHKAINSMLCRDHVANYRAPGSNLLGSLRETVHKKWKMGV